MSKRGENIYLRKDGRWEGRYIKGRKADGKPQYGSIYGKQYKIVKEKLMKIKIQLQNDTEKEAGRSDMSFDNWAEYWMQVIVKPYVKESTYLSYKRILDIHLKPSLRAKKLSEISKEDMQELVLTLQHELSSGTLHNIFRQLKSIFKEACTRGLISENPCVGLRLPRYTQQSPRVLTRQEQYRLETEIIKRGQLEYLVCLYTGMRVGELCALRWENLNFDSNLILINQTLQRVNVSGKSKIVMDSPKTEHSNRMIPVPEFIMELLKEKQNKETADRTIGVFVFQSNRKKYKDPRTVQQGLCKIINELNLRGVHMHTLRHTYATRCLEMHVGYETLGQLLGHSSPQMTLKCYSHTTMEQATKSVEKLSCIFSDT